MQSLKKKKFILLTLGIFTPLTLTTPKVNASSFGAEIFCTMREGGNDHESSWEAAYSYIKRQKGGFFKTSPKQAAAQIIETVVREKDKFSGCVEYLDQLYPDRGQQRKIKEDEREKKKEAIERENRRKRIKALMEEDNANNSEKAFDGYESDESFDRYDY